jgi:hypothetical protein
MAPGTRVPFSNTRAGVPLTLYLRLMARLRSRAEVSHFGSMDLGGTVPAVIQVRQTLPLSLAHQMSRALTAESAPGWG